jgi:hypothetical protein
MNGNLHSPKASVVKTHTLVTHPTHAHQAVGLSEIEAAAYITLSKAARDARAEERQLGKWCMSCRKTCKIGTHGWMH